jgi:hypothetical protein
MTYLPRLVIVVAAGWIGTTARAADIDKLLPATTEFVVSVNVRQILDSEVGKKHHLELFLLMLEGNDATKFLLAELGLNPLNEIEKVVIGASWTGMTDLKHLMIVRGKFDKQKVLKAAEAKTKLNDKKLSMIEDGNTVVFKFQPDNGNPPVYGTVVDDTTVIAASDMKMISHAIAQAVSKATTPLKGEIAALVEKMDDKSSIYMVGNLKGKFAEVQIAENLPIDLSDFRKPLPKIDNTAVAVKIGMDVNVEVMIGMKDEASAVEMRSAIDDLMKQLKPLAQILGAGESGFKPLVEILATVKTSASNKDVVITGKVTSLNIDKMVNPDKDAPAAKFEIHPDLSNIKIPVDWGKMQRVQRPGLLRRILCR